MPHMMVQNRIDNTRSTIRREVGLLRDVVSDVVERIDADGQTEPRSAAGMGGVLGRRGSLVKTPVKLIVGTVDNAIEHVQGFARINRQLIR